MGTRAWGVALLLGVLWANTVLAADWSVVPSINAKTEFNSNLNYDFKNPKSDFFSTLAYATDYNYTTETSQLQGRLGLTGMHYFRESSADHIDQSYQINGQYRIAPRWNLTLNSSYIVDSTLQEELTTSGLIINRTPRQSIQIGPGMTYQLTERLAATLNYNFGRVSYEDPRFRNYTNQLIGLRMSYPLKNQKTVLTGNILARETRFPGEDRSRSLGIYLGGNHKFTENWEAALRVGVDIAFLNFNTQVTDSSQSPYFVVTRQAAYQQTTASPFVDLSTTRRWTKFSITGGYSRYQAASAFGSISEVNRIYLSMNYGFTERLSGSLNANVSTSSQISQQRSLQNNFYGLSSQLKYQVTERLSSSCGYSFGTREDVAGGRTAKAHIAWLMLTYSYPIHYQK